ncbi:MAG: xanthine dehydrogenase family protein molybdopterin-binding subunit, partial [Proteobacteria bacterium]|nr:xanthine dehydrogenase family protein molybdopterin-binding subunit [Pseudomonadota bacterium]
MAADKTAYLGRSVERLEDPPLVTGAARFAADISFPGQLHMRVVRSSYAHGEIISIDTSEARAMPGVVAVWTAQDIADIGPVDFRADRAAEALKPYRQPVLAKGRVRYVGDPVAAVFAEDPYLAEDAAESVVIEVEELPVIVSADDPPGEFAAGRGTEAAVMHHSYGDIDAAFANAERVIALDLRTGRHSGVPMETRGAIGRYDAANDMLELHGAAKVPHRNQETLVRMLGRDASRVHVHECHVGGGFGVRGELYPEDILVLVAAMRLGRPVKWIEDRQEHLMCANQGREQHHLARVAVDAEGRILGIDDEFFHDQGGYVRTHGSNVANRTMCTITGPYRVPAFRAVCHFRLTNKTPCATYRAPGRYESTFVRERLMDAIATELGIDPIEVRKRNLIAAAEMPYTIAFDEPHVSDMVLDSGDYAGLLDKAAAAFGWEALRVELDRRRADGELVGAGIGMFVEEGGRGPTDGAKIAVDANGEVEVITGGASLGQGFETTMAQICAEALGVDYRRVRVIHGHTDLIPYGIGAHATRATVMTGSAVNVAALMVREIAIDAAAEDFGRRAAGQVTGLRGAMAGLQAGNPMLALVGGLADLVLSNSETQQFLAELNQGINDVLAPILRDVFGPTLEALRPAFEQLSAAMIELEPVFKALGIAIAVALAPMIIATRALAMAIDFLADIDDALKSAIEFLTNVIDALNFTGGGGFGLGGDRGLLGGGIIPGFLHEGGVAGHHNLLCKRPGRWFAGLSIRLGQRLWRSPDGARPGRRRRAGDGQVPGHRAGRSSLDPLASWESGRARQPGTRILSSSGIGTARSHTVRLRT